jgi:hypothetical protein
MANTAFNAKLRIVDNNSDRENAPERNVIMDFSCEEAEKAANWFKQAAETARMEGTTIRVYKSKSDYDEIAGFSLWGGLWGNSGKIAPMNPKPASERIVNVKANQRELPEDLPF